MPSLSKRELFKMLGYQPHAGQIAVHRSTAKRRVLACGTRWGKSTCGAMEVVAAMLEPGEDTLGWVVAPTIDLVDRIFVPVLDAIKTHFAHRIRELNLRERVLRVSNLAGGVSELRGKSTDQPVSLLGAAVDWLVVDEAARLREDLWSGFLAPRLVDRDGWALIVSTPRGGGWFHDAFRRGQKRRDPRYESWSSPSLANPHLDPALVESERTSMGAEDFAREFLAQFTGVPVEQCEVCGGPAVGVVSMLVIRDGQEPGRCPECDDLVDEAGHTVVPLWGGKRGTVTIIVWQEEDGARAGQLGQAGDRPIVVTDGVMVPPSMP